MVILRWDCCKSLPKQLNDACTNLAQELSAPQRSTHDVLCYACAREQLILQYSGRRFLESLYSVITSAACVECEEIYINLPLPQCIDYRDLKKNW
jgi:hypothetical protein